MNKTKVLIALISGLTLSSVSAKIVHNYKVMTTVTNSNGQFTEFAKSFNGWSCSTSAHTSYSEVMIDQRGDRKRVEQSSAYDYKYSTLWQGQPAYSYTAQRSFNNELPSLRVSVREICSKSKTVMELETKTRTVPDGVDSNGSPKTRTETYTEFVSKVKSVQAHQHWNCRFEQMPDSVGESIAQSCISEKSYPWMTGDTMHFTLDSLLLNFMNDKDINVDLNLLSENEDFKKINKKNEINKNAYVFKVYQGLRKDLGEDDYEIKVSVNGESKAIETSHGLLNEDFVYYAQDGEDSIEVEVAAVERDLLFDDIYDSYTKAKLFSGSNTERTILLGRGAYHSNIKVKLIKSPGIEKVSTKINSSIAQKMIERYEEERENVSMEIQSIEELEAALGAAEDNYDLTKTISIPVIIVGGVMTSIGGYQFSQTGLSQTATKILIGSGLVAMTGGTSAIVLKRSSVKKLLGQLIEKRQEFEGLLNKLDEKAMKVHANTDYLN